MATSMGSFRPRPQSVSALLAALALAAAVLTACLPQAQVRLAKPDPPIEIEATLSGAPAGPFRIAARASSRVDAEIELEILLPGGMSLVSGDRASKARRPEIRAEAAAAGAVPREILVRASLVHGSARMVRVVPLTLRSDPPPRPGVPGRNSRGEAIREFGP